MPSPLVFALCTPPQSCAWRWWYSLILLWLALNFSLCSAIFCQQWEILTICKVQVHKIYLSSLVQNAPTYELSDWGGTFSTGFHHQHNLEFSYIWEALNFYLISQLKWVIIAKHVSHILSYILSHIVIYCHICLKHFCPIPVVIYVVIRPAQLLDCPH